MSLNNQIDPINPYPQLLQNAERTILEKTNRISELEQQLELIKEANLRMIDNMLAQVRALQEKVENLLDPEERPTPNSGSWFKDKV